MEPIKNNNSFSDLDNYDLHIKSLSEEDFQEALRVTLQFSSDPGRPQEGESGMKRIKRHISIDLFENDNSETNGLIETSIKVDSTYKRIEEKENKDVSITKKIGQLSYAAANGSYFDRFMLAELYEQNEMYEEAYKQWILYTLEAPEPWRAYASLGEICEITYPGHPCNITQAKDYYEKGHQAGCGQCTYNLACLLQAGAIVDMDARNHVLKLYEIAGTRGIVEGWFDLGLIHNEGWVGCANILDNCNNEEFIDLDEAEWCFKNSYKVNPKDCIIPTAIAEAIFLAECNVDQERFDEAMQYLHEAIELGSHEACYQRAVIYMEGYGEFIESNRTLAIQDFEKLELMNESYESTFVDGLYHLGKLYLSETQPNTLLENRLSQLNKAIHVLKKADRSCYEWPNWRNREIKFNLYNRDDVSQLLNEARTERASLLLAESQGLPPIKRKIILCKSLHDCRQVEMIPSLQRTYNYILKDLINISLGFAEEPESAETNSQGTPVKSKVKKSVSFCEKPPQVHIYLSEQKGHYRKPPQIHITIPALVYLKDAIDYMRELKGIKGASNRFINEVSIKMSEVFLVEAEKIQDPFTRLDLLRNIRDIIEAIPQQKRSEEIKVKLKITYLKFVNAYEQLHQIYSDKDKQKFFIAKVCEYQGFADRCV
jgi:TPR repeat protein